MLQLEADDSALGVHPLHCEAMAECNESAFCVCECEVFCGNPIGNETELLFYSRVKC
jgi:hypothetical protein